MDDLARDAAVLAVGRQDVALQDVQRLLGHGLRQGHDELPADHRRPRDDDLQRTTERMQGPVAQEQRVRRPQPANLLDAAHQIQTAFLSIPRIDRLRPRPLQARPLDAAQRVLEHLSLRPRSCEAQRVLEPGDDWHASISRVTES